MNKWLEIFGFGFLITGYVIMIYTFFIAYFSNMTTIVYINKVGEANFETILLVFSIPIVIIFLNETRKRWNNG